MAFGGSLFAQPGLGGCNEGRAAGAAHSNAAWQSCYADFQSTGLWDVDIVVTSTGGKDGCTYVVEAWACPACHGPNPCPKIACRAIAVAYIDSDFNVWSVSTFCM